MADVVYRIDVTGLGGAGGLNFGDKKEKEKEKKFKPKSFTASNLTKALEGDVSKTELIAGLGLASAKKAINIVSSNVELVTGDSYTQQVVDFGKGIVESIFGSAISGGIATGGNPLGFVAGAVIGTTKVAIGAGMSEFRASIQRNWQSRTVQEQQKIYNYTSYGANRTGGVLY